MEKRPLSEEEIFDDRENKKLDSTDSPCRGYDQRAIEMSDEEIEPPSLPEQKHHYQMLQWAHAQWKLHQGLRLQDQEHCILHTMLEWTLTKLMETKKLEPT